MSKTDPKFMTSKQAAATWGVSEGWVRSLCRSNKVKGAYIYSEPTPTGRVDTWMIPVGTARPGNPGRKMKSVALDRSPVKCEECSIFKMLKGRKCLNKATIIRIDDPGVVYYQCMKLGRRIITAQGGTFDGNMGYLTGGLRGAETPRRSGEDKE